MNDRRTAHHDGTDSRGRGGFTLIELLVVIGIIVLLAGLLIPMVVKATRSAHRSKLASDFGVISQALEEYKKDHGDYPRVDAPNTGFAVLGKALIGAYGDGVTGNPPTNDPNDPPPNNPATTYKPGDCVQSSGARFVAMVENTGTSTSDKTVWSPFDPNDLEDGFGSRLRAGGKKTPPYLQPEKFRVRGCALLDADDKPILYFPAKAAKPNVSQFLQPGNTPSFLAINGYGQTAAGVNQNQSLFNANDNLQFFMRFDDTNQNDARRRMAVMLGDLNDNGIIDTGEQAVSTGPFLLWAPGADGFYGPFTRPSTTPPSNTDIAKCDDVMNFANP